MLKVKKSPIGCIIFSEDDKVVYGKNLKDDGTLIVESKKYGDGITDATEFIQKCFDTGIKPRPGKYMITSTVKLEVITNSMKDMIIMSEELNLTCPKCGVIYQIKQSSIDYLYCCDDCSIILFPSDRYGEEA